MASKSNNSGSRKAAAGGVPRGVWIAAVLLALAVFAAVLFLNMGSGETVTAYPVEVTVSDAAKLRDSGAFVLDVRTQEEWNERHIPGATLIPLDQLASRISEVPKGQEVVVVCRSGNRSATGRDILKKAGYEQVTSMAGGVNAWAAQGLETVSGP